MLFLVSFFRFTERVVGSVRILFLLVFIVVVIRIFFLRLRPQLSQLRSVSTVSVVVVVRIVLVALFKLHRNANVVVHLFVLAVFVLWIPLLPLAGGRKIRNHLPHRD